MNATSDIRPVLKGPLDRDELISCLNEHRVQWHKWQLGTDHTLEELLERLNKYQAELEILPETLQLRARTVRLQFESKNNPQLMLHEVRVFSNKVRRRPQIERFQLNNESPENAALRITHTIFGNNNLILRRVDERSQSGAAIWEEWQGLPSWYSMVRFVCTIDDESCGPVPFAASKPEKSSIPIHFRWITVE